MRRGRSAAAAAVAFTGFGILSAQSAVAARSASAPPPNKSVTIVASSSTCSQRFCFQPQKVKVASGNSVTWTNQAGVTHTITRCTPSACFGRHGGTGTDTGFGDPGLSNGQQYTFPFHGAGTYVYYCAIHGYAVMHGKVTVPPG
jgi:plastocyanin